MSDGSEAGQCPGIPRASGGRQRGRKQRVCAQEGLRSQAARSQWCWAGAQTDSTHPQLSRFARGQLAPPLPTASGGTPAGQPNPHGKSQHQPPLAMGAAPLGSRQRLCPCTPTHPAPHRAVGKGARAWASPAWGCSPMSTVEEARRKPGGSPTTPR